VALSRHDKEPKSLKAWVPFAAIAALFPVSFFFFRSFFSAPFLPFPSPLARSLCSGSGVWSIDMYAQRNHVATDAKITSVINFDKHALPASIISGPTYDQVEGKKKTRKKNTVKKTVF
jgi:hypothetical protein